MFVTSALSAVINNTPVVALFIPVAQEWASRFGYSISKLLLPMNHMVILAGMCTLIGTSTNLIVQQPAGEDRPGRRPGPVQPDVDRRCRSRSSASSTSWSPRAGCCRTGRARSSSSRTRASTASRRACCPNGPLVGRSIAEVGLRSMRFAYVLEISAGERLLTAVGPDEVLQAERSRHLRRRRGCGERIAPHPGPARSPRTRPTSSTCAMRSAAWSSSCCRRRRRWSATRCASRSSARLQRRDHFDLARWRAARGQARRRPPAGGRHAAGRDRPGLRRATQVQPRVPAGQFAAGFRRRRTSHARRWPSRS